MSRHGTMRYRRSSYRYAALMGGSQTWLLADVWQSERLQLLVQGRWRPDVDLYETTATIEIVVDLAGVDEDDFEVQLFEDAVVVEGRRQLPACEGQAAVYHAAGIRQGPFRVEVSLPAPIDAERIEARHDRGLLRISIGKRAASR